MELTPVISSFVAGLLTFLAPCTLPLIPAYLGFIGGVSLPDIQNSEHAKALKRKIFLNGLLFVVGFTGVFMILGTVFGIVGKVLFEYRMWLGRIGGIFIIIFGLYMMRAIRIPWFNTEKRIHLHALRPGRPLSSLLFGMTFAFGWTPCIGPVLGTALTLAASSATAGTGALLLFMFSLGLATPFLLVAYGAGVSTKYIRALGKYLNIISVIGGVFLICIGLLLLTDNLGVWVSWFYRVFGRMYFDNFLDYL